MWWIREKKCEVTCVSWAENSRFTKNIQTRWRGCNAGRRLLLATVLQKTSLLLKKTKLKRLISITRAWERAGGGDLDWKKYNHDHQGAAEEQLECRTLAEPCVPPKSGNISPHLQHSVITTVIVLHAPSRETLQAWRGSAEEKQQFLFSGFLKCWPHPVWSQLCCRATHGLLGGAWVSLDERGTFSRPKLWVHSWLDQWRNSV